jgi:hypothetical protein
MKKFLIPMLAMFAFMLTSCNDDSNGLDANTPIYQEYRVEVLWDGTVNAFANFYSDYANRTRVKLDNGASIKVNGKSMVYEATDSGEDDTFDYACTLTGTGTDVIFDFTRSKGNVLTNQISTNDAQKVNITTEMKTITNGQIFQVEESSDASAFNSSLRVLLLRSGSSTVYSADVYGTSYSFRNVPEGNYVMRLISYVTKSLQEQNSNAGGTISVYQVSQSDVWVKE